MSRVLDPEGAHLSALHRLADFRGLRVSGSTTRTAPI
jgi:hypothetical protein